MYNLFVSGREEAWDGEPWQIELSRCVHEYTENDISNRFGALDAASIAELTRLPSIFAYEAVHEKDPKFGVVRDVTVRQKMVRVEYEILPLAPFLSAADLLDLSFELDISNWEMNRTHWAVKDVNLPKELHSARGIALPPWARQATKTVDISRHGFAVALSFPGEVRDLVRQVARELEVRIGPNSYFYDDNYTSQLARPAIDTLLQDVYRRARLVVAFVGSDYQRKEWCGVEFRVIREIIMERDHNRVMYVRTDDGAVDGILKTDGYVDARRFSPAQIADFICERVGLLGP
ncbi:MAG: hypothetical protein DI534_11205 [Leifsonia xyli]|nr:MAG: hypothetical protein DI534_11205 [Leifsonia xyli]